MMYFVRYHPLKEKLRDGTLSEREALPYMILFCGLNAAVFCMPRQTELNEADLVSALLGVALAVLGVIYAYVKNGGNSGTGLIQKFVVLGWVVTFRCLLVFIVVMVVFFYFADLPLIMGKTGWYDVLVLGGFEVILYQRIGKHIADTRKRASLTSNEP